MTNFTENSKHVKIVFWTDDGQIATSSPPYPAKNHTLDWLKQMPPYIAGDIPTEKTDICIADRINRTIKTCPGINDMLSCGYIVPLWTDIIVSYDCYAGQIALRCFDEKTEHHFHKTAQFLTCPVHKTVSPYKAVINLHTPWMVKLPQGFSSYIYHPYWTETDEFFSVMPGIVDHDSFHVLNLIIRWNKLGKGEYLLKKGTPIAQILPFRREKFEMDITHGEDKRPQDHHLHQAFDGFFRKYRALAWKKKKFY